MTITKRLILMLSVALLTLIFVGGFGIQSQYQAQQRFESIQSDTLPSILGIFAVRNDFYAERILAYRDLVVTDKADHAAIDQTMAEADQSIDQHLSSYEHKSVFDDTDRKMLEENKANMATYRLARQAYLEKSRSGDLDGAKAMLLKGGGLFVPSNILQASLNAQIDYNLKLSAQTRQENNSAYQGAFWVFIGFVVTAVLISSGLGLQTYRIIQKGLSRLQNTLEEVSHTLDLTRVVQVGRMDEIGHIAVACNTLLARVAAVVGDVRSASESVSVASQQIATGNIDLSARTEQQAASLEETAASMEQLTTTVKQNTDSARLASTLAAQASDISIKGNEVVGRMVGTMGEISASSTKIADITSLIEGIAFQTNILALNAAVEAARAGEQGRGFAVVASEVRSLAQRSSSAAKEIKDLIAASVTTIQEGSSQASAVGRSTDDALQAVQRVADIIGEIASASEEQGRGIEQVNQAVSQMDQVTQQNAALVEEAAAAAQSLEAQASKLNQTVSVFKVAHRAHDPIMDAAPRSAVAPTVRRETRAPSKPAAPKPQLAYATRSDPKFSPVLGSAMTPAAAGATAGDWETF